MDIKESIIVILISLTTVCLFFYKSILHHQIPFPGDLLVSLSPYKSQSYLGYAPGGYPNLAQGMDVITEILPWKHFTMTQLQSGHIPFWNPHNFSGNPQMQNFQSAIFYPLNVFFFIFSFPTAWSVFIMLQPFLAILFMYLFLRSLNLNKPASLIGGIAFAFSSYMTVWIEYGNIGNTILWLPLVLFAINKFLRKPKVFYFLLGVFSLTMSFLAGYIQGVFYIYVVSIVYTIFISVQRLGFSVQQKSVKRQALSVKNSKFSRHPLLLRRKGFAIPSETFRGVNKDSSVPKKNFPLSPLPFPLVLSLALIFFLPILLVDFQLLPTIDLFSSSTRGSYSLNQISTLLQPLYYWVTIFVPDFFGNPAHRNYFLPLTYIERVMYISIPLLFFIVYSIFSVKDRTMRFFLLIGVIVLILTTNLPLIKYLYLLPIPMISTTVPTRALSIFIFCMIVAACYGIHTWISEKEDAHEILVPVVFLEIYFLIWLLFGIFPGVFPQAVTHKSVIAHNLIIPTTIAVGVSAIFFLKKFSIKLAIILLFLLVVYDLFTFFQKITPFAPKDLLYPVTPPITYLQKNADINRFWGFGSAYVSPDFQTYDGTYSPEGNDPLHIKEYGILLASSSNGNYPNLLPRPDANIAPGYSALDMRNPYRQKILNLLGVKYVLYEDTSLSAQVQPNYDVFPSNMYRLAWQEKPWQLYENKNVLPRFLLTSNYLIETSPRKTLHDMYTIDLAHTVLLNTTPSQKIDPHAQGTVSLVYYLPNQVILKTNTSGNTLLFLSDTYYPSWVGKIDDTITPVYKADYAFRAIVVPKGQHTVSFIYKPQTFIIGLYIAGVGLLATILFAFYLWKYNIKN